MFNKISYIFKVCKKSMRNITTTHVIKMYALCGIFVYRKKIEKLVFGKKSVFKYWFK